jgi:hypothetical protein
MKLYNDQRNAQVFIFYLFTSALHVSGFLLAHLQMQVHNFGIGSKGRAKFSGFTWLGALMHALCLPNGVKSVISLPILKE